MRECRRSFVGIKRTVPKSNTVHTCGLVCRCDACVHAVRPTASNDAPNSTAGARAEGKTALQLRPLEALATAREVVLASAVHCEAASALIAEHAM